MKNVSGNIILLHIHVYHKWTSYDIWFLKCKVWPTEIFFFLPSQPLDYSENQNSKIEKSTWRYYHFTCLQHHMMYGSWDIEQDGQKFLSFWTIFCPFTWKMKIRKKKKKKNAWRYYLSTIVQLKSWSYAILFLRYSAWQM